MKAKTRTTDELLDIALEIRDVLKAKGLGYIEGETVCYFCADRLRAERYVSLGFNFKSDAKQ